MNNEVAPCILLIEDEQDLRDLLQTIVREMGYRAIQATSGDQGIALATQLHPRLVLLDVMMPGLNGFDVCGVLKAQEETADIPIVFLTAAGDTRHRHVGAESGADDYIVKPFDLNDLQERLMAVLNGAPAAPHTPAALAP